MSLLNSGQESEYVRVDIAMLEPGSSLPKHPAGREQGFYVVSGRGRVASSDDVEFPVGPGSLVEWKPGEEHTSWADERMIVVIIQRRS